MHLILEKVGYCSSNRFYGILGYRKYDPDLRKCLVTETEDLDAVELRANLGRQIVSNLAFKFVLENRGRFVAVTFTGKTLAVCDTLVALNKEIAKKDLKENYYIARIGYSTIAQI